MDQVYGEVLDGALKALSARRAEIDWTVKTIETNGGSPAPSYWSASLDGEIQTAIERLYELKTLVDDTILHLTRLARIRK